MDHFVLALIGLCAVGYLFWLAYQKWQGGGSPCSCSKGCQGCREKAKEHHQQ